MLKDFDHLFVQNETSKRYLSKIGINRVTVVGDTRFDRVLQIREEAKELPLVKLFKGDNTFTFVAGSSWGPDEDLFLEYFNNHPEMKLIIAPHVIDENHLVEIISKLKSLAEKLRICLLLVHHTRKQQAEDRFDMISGTNGLLGCADGALILQKEFRTARPGFVGGSIVSHAGKRKMVW